MKKLLILIVCALGLLSLTSCFEKSCAHKEEILPGVEASCTQDGLTEGSKCSICGEILKEQERIPSLDHNYNNNKECVSCGQELIFTEGLSFTLDGDIAVLTGMGSSRDELIYVPSEYEGKPVTRIGEAAFKGNLSITEIWFPGTVKEIADSAFAGCEGLTRASLPEGLTSIGKLAFEGCVSLEAIKLPNTLTTLGMSAFENCQSIKSVEIPESLTNIGDLAFSWCTSLESAVVPESLIYKVDALAHASGMLSVFNACDALFETDSELIYFGNYLVDCETNLPTVSIREGTVGICAYAFANSKLLEEIVIPEGVERIGKYAFEGCDVLTRVTIPASLKTVENYAFFECRGLAEVNISSVTAWLNISFANQDANPVWFSKTLLENGLPVREVTVPATVNVINDYVFTGCESIESVHIEGIATRIGWSAFEGCINLAEINLPEGISKVDKRAFLGCASLKNIILPESTERLEWSAFEGCTALEEITIPRGLDLLGFLCFRDCTSLKTIHFTGSRREWNMLTKDEQWDKNIEGQYTIKYSSSGINPR